MLYGILKGDHREWKGSNERVTLDARLGIYKSQYLSRDSPTAGREVRVRRLWHAHSVYIIDCSPRYAMTPLKRTSQESIVQYGVLEWNLYQHCQGAKMLQQLWSVCTIYLS